MYRLLRPAGATLLLLSMLVSGCGGSGSSESIIGSTGGNGSLYANGSGASAADPLDVGPGNGSPIVFEPTGGGSGTSGGGTSGGGTSAGGTSTGSVPGNPAAGFLYVTSPTRNGGGGNLSVLGIATSGALSFIQTVANTGRPLTITRSPDGRFVYAANSVGGSITSYSVDDSTGRLTRIGADITGIENARYLTFTPDQRFAYVASPRTPFAGPASTGDIVAFRVAPDGTLIQDPTLIPADNEVSVLAADRSSRVLYAVNIGPATVSIFDIDQTTGVPTLRTAVSTVATTGAAGRPFSLAIRNDNAFAYVNNYDGQNIAIFAVSPSDGGLTRLSLFPSGQVGGLIAHPTLPVLYGIVTEGIKTFRSLPDGTLDDSAPVQPSLYGSGLAIDPTGRFVFIFDGETNSVSSFSVADNGDLALIRAYPNSELQGTLDSPRAGVVVTNNRRRLEE